jgi:hypothetical protein
MPRFTIVGTCIALVYLSEAQGQTHYTIGNTMTEHDQATQDYTQALESEQKVRQLIASIHESLVQIRQYQLDYDEDISQLEASLLRVHKNETQDKLTRTNRFMQQLLQMERDQMRQLSDLDHRLYEARQMTEVKLDALEALIQLNRNSDTEV